jgi:hypothetical protein
VSDSPSGSRGQPAKSKNPESLVMIRGLLPVRGGGIEPPWLLTASTSNGERARDDVISRGYERQETAANGCERRISAACSQNDPEGDAVITEALREVIDGWERARDRSVLRRALFELLGVGASRGSGRRRSSD